MQLQTPEMKLHRDMKAKVMAAMETGQHGQARTVIREYAEDYPDQAKALQRDVVSAYGVAL